MHSNIGGSYDDTAMADITLAWMMDQLSPWLAFAPGYISTQVSLNDRFDAMQASQGSTEKRGYAMGKIVQSCKFPTSLGGKRNRTPHLYTKTDVVTLRESDEVLTDTNEYVHASVRVRIDLGGKGWDDVGAYKPAGLVDEWVLHDEHGGDHDGVKTGPTAEMNGKGNGHANGNQVPNGDGDGAPNGAVNGKRNKRIRWVYKGKSKHGQGKVMYEDTLGPIEMELLKHDPVAYRALFDN